MILSVVNQKGGTGKTTVATNLATAFSKGDDVLLIDADPQQSALDWKADRPGNLPSVAVIGLPAPNLHREIQHFKKQYKLIIIDGGSRVTATARAAVAIADFILVPTLVSKPDVLSTQKFFREVVEEVASMRGSVSGAILLTMVKTGTIFNLSGQKQIKTLKYPVLKSVIYHRIAYQEAISMGKGVIEYASKSKAAEEILNLSNELKEVLNAKKGF